MRKIVTMGELLIDFMPDQKDVGLKDVSSFTKYAGGAPANVSVAARKYNENTYFLGQVGNDAFGDFLIDEIKKQAVDITYLSKGSKHHTSLAYVTLTKDGNRDFIFYRNPGADQMFLPSQVPEELLTKSIFHFCSVSLDDYPIKESHIKAIDIVRRTNGFVSFDPNLRLSLWTDHNKYRNVINEFIPKADLLKISDDELEFITGETDINKGLAKLFTGSVKYIILTLGSKGSTFYTKEFNVFVPAFKVTPIDTTGAGDSFIGTFLGLLSKNNLKLDELSVTNYLKIANATAALVTTKYGGMTSIPSAEEVKNFIETAK